MPKVVRIRYGKTFNLGNYQSERFEVEADLHENEQLHEAFAVLKMLVDTEGKKK